MSDVVKLFKDDEFRRAQEHVAKQWDQMMEYREKRKKEYEAAKAKTKEQLPMTTDLVNHPAHYEEQSIKLEPIDFCERLPFCEGNAIKYCFRAGHKEGASELLDLKKARWYLKRRKSKDALVMEDSDYVAFLNLARFFNSSNGILKDFINQWNNLTVFDGDFWDCLESCIAERINKLRSREALNSLTTESRE